MKNPNRFYGYKHWTLEDQPRCFNVGKGCKGRAFNKKRNHKWHAIVKRLGLRVEVCVGPMSNQRACIWEMQYIPLMSTRSDSHEHNNDADIGCNFTDGGEGTSGLFVTEETRTKLSAKAKGCVQSPETCAKKSQSMLGKNKGRKVSEETLAIMRRRVTTHEQRRNISNSLKGLHKGRKISEEVRAKRFGRKRPHEFCLAISKANKLRHARNRCATWFAKQMAGVK